MKRTTTAVGVLVGALLLAGCTSPAEEPPGLTASPTESPSPTPTPTVDPEALQLEQDEAAILDTYERYWAVVVQVRARELEPSPAAFDGVASGVAVEEAISSARAEAEQGFVYEGAPSFTETAVVVDGDAANVSACVDNAAWTPVGIELPERDWVLPGALKMERIDGVWLVTGTGVVPADLTC